MPGHINALVGLSFCLLFSSVASADWVWVYIGYSWSPTVVIGFHGDDVSQSDRTFYGEDIAAFGLDPGDGLMRFDSVLQPTSGYFQRYVSGEPLIDGGSAAFHAIESCTTGAPIEWDIDCREDPWPGGPDFTDCEITNLDTNQLYYYADNWFVLNGQPNFVCVPEPSRWLLLAAGLGCLVALYRVRVR